MDWKDFAFLLVSILVFIELRVQCCNSQRVFTQEESIPEFQRIKGRHKSLIDEYGRERIFHGFNSVEKGPPWYDAQILNATRLKYYQEWGFNVVRLGTMWSGVQPTKTTFNQTYVNILKNIMTELKVHGMYTLMDMHQDILTSKYNSYDGLPRWLIDSFPEPEHAFPWPLSGHYGVGDFHGYLSQAVSEGFQYFYDDYAGARTLFANFWKFLASVFKNDKNVLGYELINEPWVGDVYKNPELFLPGIAGERNLVPLYELTHQAIRAIDNETLVFFEPVTYGVVLSSEITGTGFSSVPGGEAYRDRSVLSWHYYCWIIGLDEAGFKKNDSIVEKVVCDDLLGPQVFSTIEDDMNNLRSPSFLTEFGNCAPDSSPTSVNTVECDFIMDLADKHRRSWTYWLSKFWLDNGDVNWPTVRAFARTYPMATQGRIVKFEFEVESGEFKMEYTINSTIRAPTEIFLPKLHYPRGQIITTSPGLRWTFDDVTRKLSVAPKVWAVSALHGSNGSIRIKPVTARIERPGYRIWRTASRDTNINRL